MNPIYPEIGLVCRPALAAPRGMTGHSPSYSRRVCHPAGQAWEVSNGDPKSRIAAQLGETRKQEVDGVLQDRGRVPLHCEPPEAFAAISLAQFVQDSSGLPARSA